MFSKCIIYKEIWFISTLKLKHTSTSFEGGNVEMSLKTSFLSVLLFGAVVSAQYSVPTINVNREFFNWKDSGINCDTNISNFWYVFKTEIDTSIKNQVRYCGGSVLYIGLKKNLHLYNQSIIVSCDSVVSLLKQDSNFINILPLIAEEKVSYEIYKDSGLYYVDSVNLKFGAVVLLNVPINDSLIKFLSINVGSVDTTGNNCRVYGTREAMLIIAGNNLIKKVYDIKKDGPVNINKNHQSKPSLYVKNKTQTHLIGKTIELNGKTCTTIKQSKSIKIINGTKRIIQ